MTIRPGIRHGWAAFTGSAMLVLFATAAPASTPNPAHGPARAARHATRPSAGATKPEQSAAPARPSTPAPAPGSIGLMAFLDPETGMLTGPIGDLVPPADQRAAAQNVLLIPVQRPNGAWLLDLKGTMMEHYVLQIDALGNRRVLCVQDGQRLPALLPFLPAPVGEER